MSAEKRRLDNFTDLDTWQEGHKLVLRIYQVTKAFPKEEGYGLVSQMRRSAVSVTSNLAEGFGGHFVREKVRFYSIAHGSLTELQNQILISRDVGYVTQEQFDALYRQSIFVHKLMTGLIKATRKRFDP